MATLLLSRVAFKSKRPLEYRLQTEYRVHEIFPLHWHGDAGDSRRNHSVSQGCSDRRTRKRRDLGSVALSQLQEVFASQAHPSVSEGEPPIQVSSSLLCPSGS